MRVTPIICKALVVSAAALVPLHSEESKTQIESIPPALGLGFEIGVNWYMPNSKPMKKGHGEFIAFDTVTGDLTLGLRFEKAEYMSQSDANNDATSTEVEYSVYFHEVRVQRALVDDVIHIGLSAGMAQVRARPVSNNDVTINRVAPTGDVFALISPITGGHYAKAAFNVLIGYRFLRIPGSDPDQAGTDYTELLHDMSGFHIGLSLSAIF